MSVLAYVKKFDWTSNLEVGSDFKVDPALSSGLE